MFSIITTRHLLVHRRRRLGHRPQLHSLTGPLANGATTLSSRACRIIRYSRFWNVIDKHQVNIFYTAPTATRALMQSGDEPVKKTSRKSLRLLGSVERADQSGSLGVVSPRGRRRPLPDRRYMVAERDRRHPDHAAARRDQAQARLGDIAVLRRRAGDSSTPDGNGSGETSGNLCITKSWPG